MRRFGRFHYFSQNPAHIFGMNKENQSAVRANARFPQHALAHGFKFRLSGVNIGHFKANMVLAALRVLLQEARNAGIARQSPLGQMAEDTQQNDNTHSQ